MADALRALGVTVDDERRGMAGDARAAARPGVTSTSAWPAR